jgi:hypothetical protein
MAETADIQCSSCGDRPPNVELRPDGGIYCRREQRVTGGSYEEVPPASGWYLAPEDPTMERYWDGKAWRGRLHRNQVKTPAFPGMSRVELQKQSGPANVPAPANATAPAKVSATASGGTKLCPECAEWVQGGALVCRFCGHRFDGKPKAVDPVTASTSGAAVAAFIASLVGLWIAGIPLGIHAQRQIDKSQGRLTGRGFATAGIVLGILGIVGTIILIIVLVSAAKHTGCTYTYNATGGCVPE